MEQVEITDKIRAIAESAGLTEEDLQVLLTGGGEIPQELMDVLERVADQTSAVSGEE